MFLSSSSFVYLWKRNLQATRSCLHGTYHPLARVDSVQAGACFERPKVHKVGAIGLNSGLPWAFGVAMALPGLFKVRRSPGCAGFLAPRFID